MPSITESHLMGDVVRKQEIYSGNCAGKGENIINKSRGVFRPYSYAAGKVFGISNHWPSESQE